MKKYFIETGYPEIIDEGKFMVLIQTSSSHTSLCKLINPLVRQSYNLKQNFFGYRGVPTSRTKLLLGEIADAHGVFIMVFVRVTHSFDVNGYDALLHCAQKRKLRNYPAPLCTDHIVRDWNRACDEVCHSRTIQRCFRALRRSTAGDIDESLVPQSIRDYDRTDDEEDTEAEKESDCEWN